MAKINYETTVGNYATDIYVNIDVRLKDVDLTDKQYTTLRDACKTIEDLAYELKNSQVTENV